MQPSAAGRSGHGCAYWRALLAGLIVAATILGLSGPASAQSPSAIHPTSPTDANQTIVVSAKSASSSDVEVSAQHWDGQKWVTDIGPVKGYIGENGFTSEPTEADGYTPSGQYNITTAFGGSANPGTAFAYRNAGPDDFWVDDVHSAQYNTWQTGPSSGRWRSAESLSDYEYALAFDFNQNPVVADGNSAIFLHEGNAPSPGCIEIDRNDLINIIRWLNPASHPVINLGVGTMPPEHVQPPSAPETTVAPAPSPNVTTLANTSLVVAKPNAPRVQHISAVTTAAVAVVLGSVIGIAIRRRRTANG